jgi:hypothetical protein
MKRFICLLLLTVTGCVKSGVHTQEAYCCTCVPPRTSVAKTDPRYFELPEYERINREGIISDSRRSALVNRNCRTIF